MIKDISFNGLTQSPSDHNCTDGDLATCLNLIPEDGTLKPIGQGALTGRSLEEGEEIQYIHKVYKDKSETHYIIKTSENIWYYSIDGNSDKYNIEGIPSDFTVNSVASVGNILCFVGESKTLYAYWTDGKYSIYDFSKLKLSIEIFQNYESDIVVSDMVVYDNEDDWLDFLEYEKINSHSPVYWNVTAIKADKTAELLNLLRSKCEKTSEESGSQCMPFVTFLVATVKLYDGTYVSFSPIYTLDSSQSFHWDEDNNKMIPSVTKFSHWQTSGYGDYFKPYPDNKRGFDVTTGMSTYRIRANFSGDYPKDLIAGVDIFITRYDDLLNTGIQWETSTEIQHPHFTVYKFYGDLKAEYLYGKDLYEHIESLPFYKSLSLDLDELDKVNIVNKVTGAEESITLADTRNLSIGGAFAVGYNNRLHIARPVESLNVNELKAPSVILSEDGDPVDIEIVVNIYNTKNERLSYLSKDDSWQHLFAGFNIPLGEYKHVDIYVNRKSATEGINIYYKTYLPLYPSETIGYSFYLNMEPLNGLSAIDLLATVTTEEEYNAAKAEALKGNNRISSSPSLIKVSEAENPLVFPAKNSVLVGSSVVNALATNTQPITEGQFGDAPLYAFTDEGTWMLMLNEEGTYSARQPVNRDICSNPNGILQIDNAVLFPTERGIILQSGKTSELITDSLDGFAFDFMKMYKENVQKQVIDVNGTAESDITYIPFRDFMKGADMVYDYYSGRIIVFNPEQTYAYVYSLKSKMWGVMHSDLKKRVNIYPEAYAINKDNNIVDLYQSQLTEDTPYFLCTRPFGLDDAEAFKTIYTEIVRGYFRNEKGKCGMVLYGSNDLFKWYAISSSVDKYLRGMCGSPYKYFRLALVGNLSPDESLSGFSTDYRIRWNNKLR